MPRLDRDASLVNAALDAPCLSLLPVMGGDIHRSYQVQMSNGSTLFAKVNDADSADVLATEYDSLKRLEKLLPSMYPRARNFHRGQNGTVNGAVLLLNFHQMEPLTPTSATMLGSLLAEHHCISNDVYGWPCGNHIGLTPQQNTHSKSWINFFRERRLEPQLKLASQRGLPPRLVSKVQWLMDHLADFIDESEITPSLLHGDLWGGNAAFDQQENRPILFDPAPYFGDAEVDLAMTKLFGGFDSEFYQSYWQHKPARSGAQERVKIYNLYHALNHFNTFGKVYENLIYDCLSIIPKSRSHFC